MKTQLSWLLCSLAACMSNAGDDRDDRFVSGGKADGAVAEGSPEALGVLAVVNMLSTDALDDDVGLDSRAAKNITSHRDGATASASDDDPFDTLAELDAIPYVGPVAFGKLLDYAHAHGFVAEPTASSTLSKIALPDSGTTNRQAWACAVFGGTVECWGRNWAGILGNGTADLPWAGIVHEPQTVPGLTGVTSVAGGASFVVALTGGDVYWWGDDPFAGIKDASPRKIAGLSGAKAITTGSTHACALPSDNTVSCWGSNLHGALGDGTTTKRTTPATVPGLTNIAAISAGGYHTCALSKTGEVWCWGDNEYGQVGAGGDDVLSPQVVPEITDATAIAAGSSHTCALQSDGQVVCWGGIYRASGNDADFYPIRGVHHAVSISAGYAHTCALESTGEVVCWGWNGLGQLGMSTAGCAWDTNGLCPAHDGYGHVVTQVANAVEISAKGGGSCARTADDHITCWGSLAESLGDSLFKTW
jgi:hypothetical protein